MKDGRDLYGWGVFDIPMERALHHIPRGPRGLKTAAVSVFLTVLCLIALLYFDRQLQKIPLPPEPKPVEVAVRILEKAPAPEPQAPPEVPPPPQPEERTAVAEAPPVAKEIPVQPQAPAPEPPRPVALTPPPPAEAPLPPPTSLQPVRQTPQLQQALPEKAAPVAARPAEDLLPDPSLSAYAQRETDTAELPEQTATLQGREAEVNLGAGPKRTRVAERGTARSALPPPSQASFAPRSGNESALPAPGAAPRYAEPANDSTSLPPATLRTMTAGSGGDVAIPLPETAAPAVARTRQEVAMLPPGERMQSSFASPREEPTLSGPAVASTAPRSSPEISEAPEGSYGFLDLMGPSDLDQSVMMNLNRLRTCLDPEEEMVLKTRLATMLSAPGRCRNGGVVFFIRHPESAYSIHIDLYNHEQREFQDRCAALRLAVDACGARR